MKEEQLNQKFEIKSAEHVVVITLWDRTFGSLSEALKQVPEEHTNQKVLMMQSIEKENEPLKIVIVFEF